MTGGGGCIRGLQQGAAKWRERKKRLCVELCRNPRQVEHDWM